MATRADDVERFDMGRVVSRTFGAIGRNAALFLGLAVLLTLIPSLAMRIVIGAPASAQDITRTGFAPFLVPLIASSLVSIFLAYMLTAAINYATVVDLDGQRPAFGRTLGIGVRYAVPLFFLAVLTLLGVYAGMILLFVPGIILALMWCVAAPAMVIEGLGVFASFGRSRALTKGHRWAIFGLFLVVMLLTFLPLMLIPLLSGAFSNPAAYAQDPFGLPQILSAVAGMLITVLFAVLIASTYVELRSIKEGATPKSLAEIFA